MKYLFFILITVCCCLFCCKSPDKSHKTVIVQMKTLSEYPCENLYPIVFHLNDSLFCPKDIWCMDSLLIVFDAGHEYMGQDFLRFYSMESRNLVHCFGKIGRGPGEFLLPRFYPHSPHTWLIVEKQLFSLFEADSLFRSANYQPGMLEVNDEFRAVNNAWLHDSVLIVHTNFEHQLTFIHLRNDSVSYFRNYPKLANQGGITDFIANTKIYDGCFGIHPATKEIVSIAYRYFPVVDLLSLRDFTTIRLVFPFDESRNQIRVVNELNAELTNVYCYYQYVFNTNNYVWLLYSGNPENQGERVDTKQEIHQFSWRGELIGRYNPGRRIDKFCVNENENRIYALSLDEAYEPEIISYNLAHDR